MRDITRRQFIKKSSATVMLPYLYLSVPEFNQKRINRIIIRSSWDMNNLVDISSLPVLYKQILRFVPQTEVILWPEETNEEFQNILDQTFTSSKVVTGSINEEGTPDTDELKEALESSDLLLYFPGSHPAINWDGSSVLPTETTSLRYCIMQDLEYIIYGLGDVPEKKEQLTAFEEIAGAAAIALVSDPVSEDKIKELKLDINNLEYGPNPLFGFDLRQETPARNFLASKNLTERRYITITIDSDQINNKSISGKIGYLIEKWIKSTEYDALLISDKPESGADLSDFNNSLSGDTKKRVKIYDGEFSPSLVGSLLGMSRIITGNSIDLTIMAINTKVPILFLTGPGSYIASQSFTEIGMKDYILDMDKIKDEKLYESLEDINENYLSYLLDFDKVNESMQKELGKTYNDMYKLLKKINPPEKSRKSKK